MDNFGIAALAIHHPRAEHVEEWAELMRAIRDRTPVPGSLGSNSFQEVASNRLVAISYWRDHAALDRFLPAAIAGANRCDEAWGERPTDVFVLRPFSRR